VLLYVKKFGNTSVPFTLWHGSNVGKVVTFSPTPPMARLRNYGQVILTPGGRSFYSNPRKRTRKARAPVTPAVKEALAKRREARRAEYALALRSAKDVVHIQATQLREVFGGHSVEYYTQEILQRARLERVRRKLSRWNVFLQQELKTRNAGMRLVELHATTTKVSPRIAPWTAKVQVRRHRQGRC
jgi:hypothetical protein